MAHASNLVSVIDFEGVIADQFIEMEGVYILYCHGGAYCAATVESHKDLLYRVVAKTGAVIFNVEYRRAPEVGVVYSVK